MCGIAGVVSGRPGNFEPSVQAMLNALAHRGPDDEGLVALPSSAGPGTVVLGSRRLAILDCSPAGHMPMQDLETGHWIVYNGEVYNFWELRATFGDVPWRSSGDTEALLRAYGRDGLEAPAQWRGMFAVAIWDAQRQHLILARDRLGIKPLYYWRGDGLVVFASEVRALLASGLVPTCLSLEGVAAFLRFGSAQDPTTIIEGVQALLPGHLAVIAAGQVTIRRYWRFPDRSASPHRHPRHDAVVGELCERLGRSVVSHLVSDVPLGVFLSGGLDSGVIAALAQRGSASPVSTWTVAFDAPGMNEGPRGSAVARALGTDHHEVHVDPRALLQQLPAALAAMDQPTIDGLNTYAVSRAVHEAGLKVALSGLGGDELFGGYATFPRSLWWQRTPATWRRPLAAIAAAVDRRMDRQERWRLLAAWERELGHPLLGLRMICGPRMSAQLVGREPLVASRWPQALTESVSYDPVTRVSILELRFYVANTLLRDTDAMSMAHGLEVRVPFLDHEVVEWALTVPGSLKLGWAPKPLLTSAWRRLVPSIGPPATKRGFVVPLAAWLRHDQALRSQVEAVFRDPDGWRHVGINPDRAQVIWRQFLRGQRGWAQPWALYVLRRWAKTHLA